MKRANVKRLYCGLACMMIAGMTVTFGACGNGAGEKTFPTPTERPAVTETPIPTEVPAENTAVGSEHWMVQLLQGGTLGNQSGLDGSPQI